MKASGWGRYPVIETDLSAPRSEDELMRAVNEGDVLARGNGRSYGDSAANPHKTLHMRHFNRLIAFDDKTGQLVAEAGTLLSDIIAAMLPRGWFPIVTPGTKLVTLGGMIAADVHGKNHHHDGSMANAVDWIDVIDATGAVQRCSREENPELFEWTFGGMGLTGVILRAAIRLRPVETGWIRQNMHTVPNLRAAMDLFDASDASTYSVGWTDCLSTGDSLGRSLVILAEHLKQAEMGDAERRDRFALKPKRKLNVPLTLPVSLVNRLSVPAFNQLYYWNGKRKAGQQIVDWDTYFYPLDVVLNWNRIYGRPGFAQFQCALPLESAEARLTALLGAMAEGGGASFLTVLKRFGAQKSRFSFPMLGYTLAVDFPATERNLKLMRRLDDIVVDHGGRFYLAKDSRMSAEILAGSDKRPKAFARMRKKTGARKGLHSSQAERLAL